MVMVVNLVVEGGEEDHYSQHLGGVVMEEGKIRPLVDLKNVWIPRQLHRLHSTKQWEHSN